MAISTETCNLALGHLAIGTELSNAETERSSEARAMRRWYTVTLKATLRSFDWGFARATQALALVATSPTTDWLYAYAYPSDCIAIRSFLSALRTDHGGSLLRHEVRSGSGQTLIYVDESAAYLRFTRYVDDPNLYSADFQLAHAALLAAHAAPQLTGGDPFKLGPRAMSLYEDAIAKARTNAANEEAPDQMPESEFVRARYEG